MLVRRYVRIAHKGKAMVIECRFGRALSIAEEVHEGVARKGTDIPYLAHVVGVSALVMEFGGNENETIAGLLHDTIEDGGDLVAGDGRVTVGKASAGYLGTRLADHAAHGFRPIPPRAGLPSK